MSEMFRARVVRADGRATQMEPRAGVSGHA